MDIGNEITLKIKVDIEDFYGILKEKGYKQIEHFIIYDTFMVPKSLDFNKLSTREIVLSAIIIRRVHDIIENKDRRYLLYKMKEFNNKDEILNQKTTKLRIYDCKEAEEFLETIGYKKIMDISEEDHSYQRGEITLLTKDVHNGDNLIEMDTRPENPNMNTISKLIDRLKKEELPLDFSNCYIKKAEEQLNKILSKN